LDVDRIIQPQLLSEPCDRFGVGTFADHLLYRVAGCDVQQQEHHHQHAEERWYCEQEAAEEKRRQGERAAAD
jgi:hypothetical protein